MTSYGNITQRHRIVDALRGHSPTDGYSDEPQPLAAYGLLVGVFNAAFAASLAARWRSEDEFPERISVSDVVLLGVATHKLARVVTKDFVTSPFRAPFVRYEGDGEGHGEVSESPRGQGLRRAMGELLTCPNCFGQWIAAAGVVGLLFAPRRTRVVAGTFAAVAVSDVLQLGYLAATRVTTRLEPSD